MISAVMRKQAKYALYTGYTGYGAGYTDRKRLTVLDDDFTGGEEKYGTGMAMGAWNHGT